MRWLEKMAGDSICETAFTGLKDDSSEGTQTAKPITVHLTKNI